MYHHLCFNINEYVVAPPVDFLIVFKIIEHLQFTRGLVLYEARRPWVCRVCQGTPRFWQIS